MKQKFRIFTVALVACIFILANNVQAFTSSDYYARQNVSIGLESMKSIKLSITLNGDYTLNGVVCPSGSIYVLNASGTKINLNGVLYDSISFIPKIASNTIKIVSNYSRNYLGTLTFKIDSSTKVFPINTLYIEDYLKGVVGKEMSDYFPIEALKAQAIAARNYALANVSKHINQRGYSLCDTIDCQVYGGYETPLINVNLKVIAAVDATKGKVLLSEGNIITAFYSASNGGYTEASENVWSTALPYIKAKQDIYDGYDANYNWDKTISNVDINDLFRKNLKILLTDTFVRIDPNSITKFPSGRIKNITLIFKNLMGIEYPISYTKESARTFLNLNSALYNVKYVSSTTPTATTLGTPESYSFFNGKGIGHGIGMSQIGAKNRANAGLKFDAILGFYYDGTTLLNVITNFTVTFNSQGGNAISNNSVIYNSVIAAPSSPTKTGYIFGGWYKDVGCLNAWDFTTNKVTANTTLYAKWTINNYTVIFNSQGGNAISNKIANYNSAITAPASPTKTGYTFGGWYKEAGCLNAWNFTTNKITANTTLYSKWTAASSGIPASLNAPTGFKVASSSYNSTNTSWGAVVGAGGYEVYKATSSAGPFTLISTTTTTSYNYIGLTTNMTYYYKVRAYKMVGTVKVYGGFSTMISAKPIPSMPGALKAISTSYNSINISWNAVNGANGYEVYRAISSIGAYALVSTTTATNYNNTGLTTNMVYYYKVRAYRMVGTLKVYSYFLNAISSKPILAVPVNLKATPISSTSIKLTWSTVTGANGYDIYRAISSNGIYISYTRTKYLYFTNTGLITGNTYYYKMRSYRDVGVTRVYSNWSVVAYAKP